MRPLLILMVAALGLAGCGSVSIDGDEYMGVAPAFAIEEFFDGDVRAWGIVQDRSGNVVQRFQVNIDGSLEGGVLTLDETFEYGVGEGTERRVWTIREDGEGFAGMAGDIAGMAEGTSHGNAFRWTYEMDLPVGNNTYRVRFDDWIWAFDETAVMNRSYIRKFGITFAEVTIFMQRQDSAPADAAS